MRQKKIIHIGISFATLLLLSGCTALDSKYNKPSAPIPENWPSGEAYKLNTIEKTEHLAWEKMILDDKLRDVIKIALEQNRSLKEAIINIESARAIYRIQNASEFPTLDASVSKNKARSLNTSSSNDSTNTSQSYSATLGLSSYELDIFGKARNLSVIEFEKYLSLKETERSVRISLIAEVTNAWLTMATDKSLLDFSKATALSSQKSLNIIEARVEAGVDSKVALYGAQTIYYKAQSDIAKYTTLVAQDQNALDLLAGEKINEQLLPEGLKENIESLSNIPVGLSSKVLLSRPDILEAEHNLKAANANISVARAAYFPSISLTASTGIASTALSNLFSGGAASVWSFAPIISLPIFDWGSKDANLDYAKSQNNLYIAKYELAIQTAFSEVADALAQKGTIQEQISAQENLVTAFRNSFYLSDKRYKLGVDTYLNTLISQRDLYSAEQTLISLRLTEISNRVTLYRVLAGGIE